MAALRVMISARQRAQCTASFADGTTVGFPLAADNARLLRVRFLSSAPPRSRSGVNQHESVDS